MRKTYFTIFILIALVTIFSQCAKKSKTSQHGSAKSHYLASDCMSCHNGDKAKEVFTVAGSVLNESRTAKQNNATIKLYTKIKATGKLVATLYSDEMGNFYTTQKIDFSQGLFVTLLGTPGVPEDTKHMDKPLFTGNCNSCHGPVGERLGID